MILIRIFTSIFFIHFFWLDILKVYNFILLFQWIQFFILVILIKILIYHNYLLLTRLLFLQVLKFFYDLHMCHHTHSFFSFILVALEAHGLFFKGGSSGRLFVMDLFDSILNSFWPISHNQLVTLNHLFVHVFVPLTASCSAIDNSQHDVFTLLFVNDAECRLRILARRDYNQIILLQLL